MNMFVLAQTPPAGTPPEWLPYAVVVILIVVLAVVTFWVVPLVAKMLTPEQAKAAADSFERGFTAGKQAAEASPLKHDDLAVLLGEPLVTYIVTELRKRGIETPADLSPNAPPVVSRDSSPLGG
jgi:hypothetical protein